VPPHFWGNISAKKFPKEYSARGLAAVPVPFLEPAAIHGKALELGLIALGADAYSPMSGAPAFPGQGRLSAVQQAARLKLADRVAALAALKFGQVDAGRFRPIDA
jgi:hypothetical protein